MMDLFPQAVGCFFWKKGFQCSMIVKTMNMPPLRGTSWSVGCVLSGIVSRLETATL